MNKLLIATMTAGLAVGAFAGDADLVKGKDTFEEGTTLTAKVWGPTNEVMSIASYDEASTELGAKYAHIETDSASLNRYFTDTTQWMGGVADTVNFGDVYVDTWVKFTAAEEEPAVEDGAQFALWYQATEADANAGTAGFTNLCIKCGKMNDSGEASGVVTVKLDVSGFEADSMQRVTIKPVLDSTIGDNGTGFFLVYINGNLVGTSAAEYAEIWPDGYEDYVTSQNKTFADNHQLFPSIRSSTEESSGKLTSVGFSGTGDIDNVNITDEDPIPPAEVTIVLPTSADWTATCGQAKAAIGAVVEFTLTTTGKKLFKNGTNAMTVDGTVGAGGAVTLDPKADIETVDGKAQIGTTIYLTLDAALEAAATGNTVAILEDLTVNDLKSLTKDLTIDANGNVLTFANAAMTLTQNIKVICTGTKTDKGVKNYAQITIAAGKKLDLSALNWGEGIIATEQPASARFILDLGATYKQGDALWADQTLTIFSATTGNKITKTVADNVVTITAEADVYDITITTPENGTLETSVTNGVAPGTLVTVTATPAATYKVDKVYTNDVELVAVEDVYSFVMPADAVTVSATFVKASVEPVPVPQEDTPQAVTNALDTAGVPEGDTLRDVVTTKNDVVALNTMIKNNQIASYSDLTVAQKANLSDSFLMKDITGDKLFEDKAGIEVTSLAPTATAGKYAIEVTVKEGDTPISIAQTGAEALAGKIQVANTLGADTFGPVTAGNLTNISVSEGKATFDLVYGADGKGFMKVNVTK